MPATRPQPSDIVYEVQRTRSTGTRVYLQFAPYADASQPWLNVCDTHGTVCSHETRMLAESFTHHPEEWCEVCMSTQPNKET